MYQIRKGGCWISRRCTGRRARYARTLNLDGDEVHDSYYYTGVTNDLEYRVLQHTCVAPGGSNWTAKHPTNEIMTIRIHETMEEAMAVVCANWNLWAGRLKDFDAVRGARLNGCDPLKLPPRGWRIQAENAPE